MVLNGMIASAFLVSNHCTLDLLYYTIWLRNMQQKLTKAVAFAETMVYNISNGIPVHQLSYSSCVYVCVFVVSLLCLVKGVSMHVVLQNMQ